MKRLARHGRRFCFCSGMIIQVSFLFSLPIDILSDIGPLGSTNRITFLGFGPLVWFPKRNDAFQIPKGNCILNP